jgi:hypothetical protein
MNRRKFIKGLTATPLVAALPTAIGSDLFVGEGGAQFYPFAMTASDAEFVAYRQFQIHEICRCFSIPATHRSAA